MADNKDDIPQNNKLDDPQIDDFDFDEFDIDGIDSPTNDRSPVVKFSKSAVEGMKSKATDPTFVKNTVIKALPREYGRASNLVSNVTETGKDIYKNVSGEFRNTTRSLKLAARQAKPAIENMLPEWASKKLDKFLEAADDDTTEDKVEVDPREAELGGNLSSIFKKKMELDAKKDADNKRDEVFKDFIQDKRQNQTTQILGNIRSLVARKVAYQDEVETEYQRKSLELQYRQYFTLTDILNLQKVSVKDQLEQLRSITKNTGLPDYLKIRNMEFAEQIFKENLYGRVQHSITDKLNPALRSFADKLKGKATEFGENIRSAAEMSAQVGEMGTMADDFGIDKNEMAGEMAGGSIAEYIGNKIADQLRRNRSQNSRIQTGADALGRIMDDQDAYLEEYAQSFTSRTGILGGIEDMFKASIRENMVNKGNVGDYDPSNLSNSAYFDNLTHKSIVEIIPSYLSKILAKIPNDGPGDDPIVFDYDQNKFVQREALKQRTANQAYNPMDLERLSADSNKLVDMLDEGKTLSAKERENLRQVLINQLGAKKRFDPKSLLNNGELDSDTALSVEAMLAQTLETDADGNVPMTARAQRRFRSINQQYRTTRNALPDNQERFNFLYNTGQRDLLQELGLTTSMGRRDQSDLSGLVTALRQFESGERKGYQDEVPSSQPVRTVSSVSDRDTSIAARVSSDVIAQLQPAIQSAMQTNPTTDSAYNDRQDQEQYRQQVISKIDEIILSLQANNLNPQANETVELLQQLSQAVKEIKVTQVDASEVMTAMAAYKDQKVGALRKRVSGLVGKVTGSVGGLYNAGAKLRDTIIGKVTGAGKSALAFGNTVLNKGRDKWNVAMDVYGKFSAGPLLTKAKMQAGQYRDAVTGEVIRRVSDIKNAVVDEDGNLVLSAQQIKDGLRNAMGKRIDLQAAKGKVRGLWDMARKALPGKATLLSPLAITKALLKGARSLVTPVKDVYVKGEGSPRLRASLFKQGMYFSKLTGKVLSHQKEIDGEVVDANGNVILSTEDYRKGIVDIAGNAFVGLRGKIAQLAKGTLGVARKAGSFVKSQVVKGIDNAKALGRGAAGLIKAGLPTVNINNEGSGKTMPTLTRIHNLLVEWSGKGELIDAGILPTNPFKRKSKPKDDADTGSSLKEKLGALVAGLSGGSFFSKMKEALTPDDDKPRVGSWQWLQAQRAKRKSAKPEETSQRSDKEEKDSGLPWGTLMAILTGIAGSVKGMFGKITDMVGITRGIKAAVAARQAVSGMGDMGMDADVDQDGKKRRSKPKGKRGLLSRGWSFLKRNAGKVARVGLTAATVGGTALLNGAAAVGTAAASVVSAPVVLTAAAIAATAYGAYRVYKYFDTKPTPVDKARWVQYGADPDDWDSMAYFKTLEEHIKDRVTWAKGMPKDIDMSKGYAPFYAMFEIDPNDEQKTREFQLWFQRRFKQVYLAHLAVKTMMFPSTTLQDVHGKLDKGNAKRYILSATHSAPAQMSPFSISASPFNDTIVVTGKQIVDRTNQEAIEAYMDVSVQSKRVKKATKVAPTSVDTSPRQVDTPTPSTIRDKVTPPKTKVTPTRRPTRIGPKMVDVSPTTAYSRVMQNPTNAFSAASDEFPTVQAKVLNDLSRHASMPTNDGQGREGLFGFTGQKWRELMNRYAKRLGIPANAKPTDPNAASLLMAAWLHDVEAIDTQHAYLMHTLGEKTGRSIYQAQDTRKLTTLLTDNQQFKRLGLDKDQDNQITVSEYRQQLARRIQGESYAASDEAEPRQDEPRRPNAPVRMVQTFDRREDAAPRRSEAPVEVVQTPPPKKSVERPVRAPVQGGQLYSQKMEEGVDSMNQTLTESLSVQRSTMNILASIATTVIERQSATLSDSQIRQRTKEIEEIKASPVSMRSKDLT